MDAIKDKIRDVLALVKAKFGGTTLPTDVLNNSIGEMFLFHKCNLSIVKISGNKIYLFIYLLFIKTLFKVGT